MIELIKAIAEEVAVIFELSFKHKVYLAYYIVSFTLVGMTAYADSFWGPILLIVNFVNATRVAHLIDFRTQKNNNKL